MTDPTTFNGQIQAAFSVQELGKKKQHRIAVDDRFFSVIFQDGRITLTPAQINGKAATILAKAAVSGKAVVISLPMGATNR